ncbi:MAG TPA: hypothetical protein VEW03_10035 [Longimicrobiaceae bacterium]|nr:hypothetical protein [Longimicrobiaceae bacterium]
MSAPDALPHSRTHAPPFHLLTGEYPPQRGGVADYTRVLAEGLLAAAARPAGARP